MIVVPVVGRAEEFGGKVGSATVGFFHSGLSGGGESKKKISVCWAQSSRMTETDDCIVDSLCGAKIDVCTSKFQAVLIDAEHLRANGSWILWGYNRAE